MKNWVRISEDRLTLGRLCDFFIVRGTTRFFSGKNEYGWWVGVNLLPGRFGLMLDHSWIVIKI